MALREARRTGAHRPPRTAYVVVRYGLFGVIGVAGLAVLYSVFWFVVANSFRNSVTDWFDERRPAGAAASFERAEIGGFPFALRTTLRQAHIGGAPESANGEAAWQWRSQRFSAEVKPWSFRRLTVKVGGRQELQLPRSLRLPRFEGALDRARIALVSAGDGLPSAITLGIVNLDLTSADGRLKIAARGVEIAARRLFPDNPSNKTATFSLRVGSRTLSLPSSFRLPLGHQLGRLNIRARLLGVVPRQPLLRAVIRWRDDGGTVELDAFDTNYGPLRVRASGTLALDAQLQPVGALTAKIQGFFKTVDVLRSSNIIRSRDAAMAKLTLGALSKRSKPGAPPSISIPLTIQDQTLFAGPVQLFKIPTIKWRSVNPVGEKFRIVR